VETSPQTGFHGRWGQIGVWVVYCHPDHGRFAKGEPPPDPEMHIPDRLRRWRSTLAAWWMLPSRIVQRPSGMLRDYDIDEQIVVSRMTLYRGKGIASKPTVLCWV
jgi:hypothetical protein